VRVFLRRINEEGKTCSKDELVAPSHRLGAWIIQIKNEKGAGCQWLTPVIFAIQGTEIRRTAV
jgi:hypothetical protein